MIDAHLMVPISCHGGRASLGLEVGEADQGIDSPARLACEYDSCHTYRLIQFTMVYAMMHFTI
jgi:hypothetical protein